MMLVTESLEYWRTRFQTLITSPQVVSTNRQPLFFQFPPRGHFCAESGNNDDVFRSQLIDLLIPGFAGNRHNAHSANLIVDFRVVNDFPEQENAPVG